MSDNVLRMNNRSLRTRFLERCYDEGVDPVEVLEAWIKRAVRQEGSVRPAATRDAHLRAVKTGGGPCAF